jgi:penicillin-binding protein 2
MTTIDTKQKNFDPVIEGMNQVYKTGTASSVQVPEICGNRNGRELCIKLMSNSPSRQIIAYSLRFVPKRQPKDCYRVFIEMATGDLVAAKIASLMIEKTFER